MVLKTPGRKRGTRETNNQKKPRDVQVDLERERERERERESEGCTWDKWGKLKAFLIRERRGDTPCVCV
jgi:hypothetical protein